MPRRAVDALIRAGADPKAATRLGATPLYIAAEDGNPTMIAKLLAAGADPNTTLRGGETALHSMLCSCAAGLAVVGIDDGLGAGTIAARIARGRE